MNEVVYVNIYVDQQVKGFYCLCYEDESLAKEKADSNPLFVCGIQVPKTVFTFKAKEKSKLILLK